MFDRRRGCPRYLDQKDSFLTLNFTVTAIPPQIKSGLLVIFAPNENFRAAQRQSLLRFRRKLGFYET